MSEKKSPLPWYHKGVRFSCTQCGKCCTGSPGYVWISDQEIFEMAAFLKMEETEFRQKYVRQVGDRQSLIELKPHYDCVFLKDKKCQIYGARPLQCRTFPWWPGHLDSPRSLQVAAESCEGFHQPDAPLVSFEEIEKERNKHF